MKWNVNWMAEIQIKGLLVNPVTAWESSSWRERACCSDLEGDLQLTKLGVKRNKYKGTLNVDS